MINTSGPQPSFWRSPIFFLGLALVLFFPAFLLNLGDQLIIEDEAIRALVAFEMHKSGDYITPTIGGDLYLRKPPLYNWLVVASYELTGSYSETSLRLPMVLSLLFFAMTIFFMVRKEVGDMIAALNALIFITLGRIIFYETLHGLIDITFSWLTYLFFILSWQLFKKEKYLALFLSAYLIAALTWMMKGLPSLVFLGLSLLVLFISNKKFKMLFNWRHFAGFGLFVVLVGIYYWVYFARNDITPVDLFMTLLGQTTRRTVIRFGWWTTVRHLFQFPLDMFYHFLPWSLVGVLLLAKGAVKKIWNQPFLRYNILLVAINIIPYWTSPEVHPRYILMLMPLVFVPLAWVYFEEKKNNSIWVKIVEYAFGTLLVLAVLAPFGALFAEVTKDMDHILLIAVFLSVAIGVIAVFYWKQKLVRLLWLAIAMLVIRIGFDLVVLPQRQHNAYETNPLKVALEMARKTEGETLVSYWNDDFETDFYYNRNNMNIRFHYPFSVARDEIVYISSNIKPGIIYFALPEHIEHLEVEKMGILDQGYNDTEPLVLFKQVDTGVKE